MTHPLSDKEREQRRQAARARWAAYSAAGVGGVAAGGGAGEFAARRLVDPRIAERRGAISQIRQTELIPGILRNTERTRRWRAAVERVSRAGRGKNTVTQAIKTLRRELRIDENQARQEVRDVGENPRFDPQSGQFESPDVAAQEWEERLQPQRDRITDLRENYRPPSRTAVGGAENPVTVRPHTRRGRARYVTVTPDDPRYPEPRRAGANAMTRAERLGLIDELRDTLTRESDAATRDSLERQIDYYTRPRRVQLGRTASQQVGEQVRQPRMHIRRTEGYPDAKGLRDLRDRLRTAIDDRNIGWQAEEAARRVARLAGAKHTIRGLKSDVQFLRHSRIGLIGAAALAGGAASLALVSRLMWRVRSDKNLAKLARSPQDDLAKNIAETYRAWIDRLLGKSDASIDLINDTAKAIAEPIMRSFAYGATQPPLDSTDGKRGYHVDVDFDALNPAVRRHMADYALDRIVEISTAQREAIRGVLMNQSVLQGIGPRDAARSVREHIGLTSYQMGIVEGYRRELETLNPAALERKLRDARFDRTVRKAIETDTPLTDEQIDRMVDAYHRRFLALRAQTIARTESIRATSYGALARAQDVLDQHQDLEVVKRWIATEDERTRDTHRDLDGKEVTGLLTPFKTTAGNEVRWPVDAESPAAESVNCRCSLGFRFIPKPGRPAGRFAADAV